MAATDSPGGPPMAGDHPQRDRTETTSLIELDPFSPDDLYPLSHTRKRV